MDALPKRKPNRLREYDYASAGGYFLTICTVGMNCIFSHVDVGAACGRPPVVTLTALGKIVEQEIRRLDCVSDCVHVDHYVIMPNHVHLLLMIDAESGRPQAAPTVTAEDSGQLQAAPAVSRIVNQFKGAVTKRAGKPVWQKGFHDHVIRDDRDFLLHLQYIDENPAKCCSARTSITADGGAPCDTF